MRSHITALLMGFLLILVSVSNLTADDAVGKTTPEKPTADKTVAKPDAIEEEADPVNSWMKLLGNSDLKITPEQQQKIHALMDKVRADFQQAKTAASSEQVRALAMAQLKERSTALFQKYQAEVNDILTPQQKQRLEQLMFQIRGYSNLQDDGIADYLKLTPEQREKIKTLLKENEEQRRELRQAPRPHSKDERVVRREKRRELRHTHQDLLKQVLTPEQLQEFKKLQGPPSADPLPESTPLSGDDSPVEEGVELGSPQPLTKK
ncbi:MAG: hypothetical protein U0903_17950 [Planctomycetales bacterium]